MSAPLSRRHALRTLASVSALALPATAIASLAHPDAALFSLQTAIEAADREFEASMDALNIAEETYLAIKTEKPTPPGLDAESKALIEEFGKRMREIRDRGPSPEWVAYEEAVREREEASARARIESGVVAAEEFQSVAGDAVTEVRQRILAVRATTLAGLIFKAKYAAAHYGGDPDQDVMDSVIDDLLAMA